MKKNKLYLALVLEDFERDDLNTPLFWMSRTTIGTIDETTGLFTDMLSNQKLSHIIDGYNLGLTEGYAIPIELNQFKIGPIFNKEKLSEYITYMDNMVFMLLESGELAMTLIKDFEEQTKTNLNQILVEDINILTEGLITGSITIEDYIKSTELEETKNNTKEIENVIKSKLNKPISEVISKIKENIINQDDAVKQLVTSIYKYAFFGSKFKSNILIYGPSGCGKTALIKEMSNILDMPVHIEDMTKFTVSGYKGASVEDILLNLYKENNYDLSKAEHSILFLDEIDKKAKVEESEVTSSGVLKSLLKIIEGEKITLEIDPTSGKTITFDTSNLLVIAGGAFTDLYNNKSNEKKNSVGFGSEISSVNKQVEYSSTLTIKDFEKFGMPLEFMGRFKTIIKMNKLNESDLIRILKTSNLSELKQYIELLQSKNINVELPEEIYEKIASIAYSYGTGARALNIVVDNIFDNILYELFEDIDKIESIKLGENITNDKNDFTLKKRI